MAIPCAGSVGVRSLRRAPMASCRAVGSSPISVRPARVIIISRLTSSTATASHARADPPRCLSTVVRSGASVPLDRASAFHGHIHSLPSVRKLCRSVPAVDRPPLRIRRGLRRRRHPIRRATGPRLKTSGRRIRRPLVMDLPVGVAPRVVGRHRELHHFGARPGLANLGVVPETSEAGPLVVARHLLSFPERCPALRGSAVRFAAHVVGSIMPARGRFDFPRLDCTACVCPRAVDQRVPAGRIGARRTPSCLASAASWRPTPAFAEVGRRCSPTGASLAVSARARRL